MNGIVAYVLAKKLSQNSSAELQKKITEIDTKIDTATEELTKQIESISSGITDIRFEEGKLVFELADGSTIEVEVPNMEVVWQAI